MFTTIVYLVTCLDCDEHNPIGYYSYLSFATNNGREHALSSSHKLVTISEIICDNDKALESIRIDIKFL
jgi:hypothetical protein